MSSGGDSEVMLAVMQALFVLTKTAMAHGGEHPFALKMAEKLSDAVNDSSPPWTLQFIRGGVFLDRELVELGLEGYRRAQTIARALENLGYHELILDKKLDGPRWLEFGEALARGVLGPSDMLEGARIDGLTWRAIPNASWGGEAEEVDPEVYAICQIALALEEAPKLVLSESGAWPWGVGLAVLRRLERAVESDLRASVRALEMAPGGWTPERRAISVAFDVLCVLMKLGVSKSTLRVASHVALAIASFGFKKRAGEPLVEALEPVLQGMLLNADKAARTGMPPHHLKVVSIMSVFYEGTPLDWLPFMHLINLAYDLELQRCPDGVEFALTKGDLLAEAARGMGTVYPTDWVKAIISVHGAKPPGAYVQLADGRVGVVLDSREASIDVLVGGLMVHVDDLSLVRLLSTMEAQAALG